MDWLVIKEQSRICKLEQAAHVGLLPMVPSFISLHGELVEDVVRLLRVPPAVVLDWKL
jgi:hypothetical protein